MRHLFNLVLSSRKVYQTKGYKNIESQPQTSIIMIWCEEQSFLAQPEQMPPKWLLNTTEMYCSKVLKARNSNPRADGWAPWKLSVKVDPGLMASMLLLQLLLAAGEPWHFLFTYLSLPLSSSDLLFHVSPFSYEDLSLVASCPSLQDDFILRFLH